LKILEINYDKKSITLALKNLEKKETTIESKIPINYTWIIAI